jgi:hypothetical protein
MKRFSFAIFLALTSFAALQAQGQTFRNAFGPLFNGDQPAPPLSSPHMGTEPIHRWNQIAVDASGLDHTPVVPPDPRVFGEQLGPGRSSRAMAIVHIAIFDAVNAISPRYTSFTGVTAVHNPVSLTAAVSQSAHDTLVALYPSQTAAFNARLAEDLALVQNDRERAHGIDLGQRVAAAILAMRKGDGSEIPEPRVGINWITSDQPGHWRQDPISLIPLALGAHWGECLPFVLPSNELFRCPPPPDMTSDAYTAAYNEVKNLGGDGVNTPTQRTAEQTFTGTFWAYDGTPSLCAPPRLYNQITVQIANRTYLQPVEFARLLALVNVSMAEAAMSAWESKYHYDLWRPITGIRESDPGSGPTGLGDGNPNTVGDQTFHPLGAPASNLQGPNFTPPFPAYPSGHATFGGAIFQILRRFYGTDHISFMFVSDEFNGTTRDNGGNVRPYMPRHFSSLSQAEEENGQSRIYLGIHWSFDKTEGITQGRRVADYIYDNAFRPVHH